MRYRENPTKRPTGRMKETKFIYRYNYSKIIHQTILPNFTMKRKPK